MDFVSRLLG